VTRAGVAVMTLRKTTMLRMEESKLAEIRKVRQMKSKFKSMLVILFYMKGIVQKEFVLAGQTVNSAYCCDVLR
jgi:hypothetical protein